jgi:hypothetical protein
MKSAWEVMPFMDGYFYIGKACFAESEFAEIGPPCSRDDAEQLAKAREQLRLARKALRALHRIGDVSICEIIEQSGVLL